MKAPKVNSDDLRNAAISAMKAAGHSIQRKDTGTRSMIYELENGKTVRLRTTNDPVLVVVAKTSDLDSPLNIEGTDYLLIAMPEVPRTPGDILVYLVPTARASEDVKNSHKSWLETNPQTKGDNRTRNIWFNEKGTPWSGYHEKWSEYKLSLKEANSASTLSNQALEHHPNSISVSPKTVAEIIEHATREISEATGFPYSKIKIELRIES